MIILYVLLLIVILAAVFWQYVRVFFSRVLTLLKIEKLCRENEIAFKLINNSYAFAKNNSDSFDFLLRVGDTVIPVKFYSALSKKSVLTIDRSGKACISEAYRKPLSRSNKKEASIVKKYTRLPNMKIKKNMISKKYTCIPIFLNEPEFHSVRVLVEGGKPRDIHDESSLVGGCNWFDRDTFTSLLMLYGEKERERGVAENMGDKTENA